MMDEKFFAWLDGELDGSEAAEMEARVAADPELAKAAAENRALARRLRGAFDPIAEAPVPERLSEPLQPNAAVTNIAGWRQRKEQQSPRALPQWAAMAATLAVGILTGTMVGRDGGEGPVDLRDGQIIAAAALDDALDRQLASAGDGAVRVALTFRDQSGRICRSFTDAGSSGLACRDGENGRGKALFAGPERQDAP
jgi:anti-sigma factor RsiW